MRDTNFVSVNGGSAGVGSENTIELNGLVPAQLISGWLVVAQLLRLTRLVSDLLRWSASFGSASVRMTRVGRLVSARLGSNRASLVPVSWLVSARRFGMTRLGRHVSACLV